MAVKKIVLFTSPEMDTVAVDSSRILFIRGAKMDIALPGIRGTVRWDGTWIYFSVSERIYVADDFQAVIGSWLSGRSQERSIIDNRVAFAIAEWKEKRDAD